MAYDGDPTQWLAPAPSPADQVREQTRLDLIAARALIKHRWGRGIMEQPSFWGGTKYCAMGAIKKAAGGISQRSTSAIDALVGVLKPEVNIARWNDDATSKRTVLAGFDRAIASLQVG